MRQRHQTMKPQVRYFVNQLGLVGPCRNILGSHDHFGGFFTDFLEEGVRSLVQQTRHVT